MLAITNIFGLELWPLVIICALVFVAGFIDAIAGGGGLISLPAYMFVGIAPHAAVATNKLASSIGTCVSAVFYAKSGYVHFPLAFLCVPFALIGSALGASTVLIVDAAVLKVVIVCVLPVVAFYVLRSKTFDREQGDVCPTVKTKLLCIVIAFLIGFYDGFYGPGTGTFLIIALTGIARLKLSVAAGVTKIINLSTNVSALVVFLVNGQVLVPLGLLAGLFSMFGNWLGASAFAKSKGLLIKPLVILVLIILFVKVAADALPVTIA